MAVTHVKIKLPKGFSVKDLDGGVTKLRPKLGDVGQEGCGSLYVWVKLPNGRTGWYTPGDGDVEPHLGCGDHPDCNGCGELDCDVAIVGNVGKTLPVEIKEELADDGGWEEHELKWCLRKLTQRRFDILSGEIDEDE